MRRITIKRARTWHYRKMRPCIEQSNAQALLSPFRSWLDCTTNTSGYDFRKGQVRSLAQQPGRKLPSAVPATRGCYGEVQGHQNPAEICRRARLDPQPLQSRPSPQRPPYLQTERSAALADWRQLAA